MFFKNNAFYSKDKKIQKMLDILQKWEYSYNAFLSILHNIGDFDERINVNIAKDDIKKELKEVSFQNFGWVPLDDTLLEIIDKNGKIFHLKIINMEYPRGKGKQNPHKTEYCLYEESEDGIARIYNNESIKKEKNDQGFKINIIPSHIICFFNNSNLFIESNGLYNGYNSVNYTFCPHNSNLTFTANLSNVDNLHYQELHELIKNSEEQMNFEYLFNLIRKVININDVEEAIFSVKKGVKLNVKIKFNNGFLTEFSSTDYIDNGSVGINLDNNNEIVAKIRTQRTYPLDSKDFPDGTKEYVDFLKRMRCKQ